MGIFDTLLKQVVANVAAAFASWVLQAEIDAIEPVSIELPARPSVPMRCFGRGELMAESASSTSSFKGEGAARRCRGVCWISLRASHTSMGFRCKVR